MGVRYAEQDYLLFTAQSVGDFGLCVVADDRRYLHRFPYGCGCLSGSECSHGGHHDRGERHGSRGGGTIGDLPGGDRCQWCDGCASGALLFHNRFLGRMGGI